MECTFKLGKMNSDSLKHPVLYNLLKGESNEVNRVGLVLSKSVNKQMKKYLDKQLVKQSDKDIKEEAKHVSNWANNISSVKIELETRQDSYRVKVFEIEVASNGIFAMAQKYEDEEGEVD